MKVATLVVLLVLLYVVVAAASVRPESGGMAMNFDVARDARNWTLTLRSVPSGKLPSGLFLLLRGPTGSVALPRTSFENLTAAGWPGAGALFDDAHPADPEVRPGDRVVLDAAAHPAGTTIEFSTTAALLATRTLS